MEVWTLVKRRKRGLPGLSVLNSMLLGSNFFLISPWFVVHLYTSGKLHGFSPSLSQTWFCCCCCWSFGKITVKPGWVLCRWEDSDYPAHLAAIFPTARAENRAGSLKTESWKYRKYSIPLVTRAYQYNDILVMIFSKKKKKIAKALVTTSRGLEQRNHGEAFHVETMLIQCFTCSCTIINRKATKSCACVEYTHTKIKPGFSKPNYIKSIFYFIC